MKIHILEHSIQNFRQQRGYHYFTQRCLNPIGIGGDEPILHQTWESVLASGAKVVLYFYPPWDNKPLTDLKDSLPSGKSNDKGEEKKPIGIQHIRGSRYFKDGVEIIPTYHPLTCIGTYKNWWLIGIDFKRYIRDSKTKFKYPEFKTHICKDFRTAMFYLNKLREVSVTYGDIEGTLDSGGVTCLGFSLSEREGFTIPFCDLNGRSVFNLDEEVDLWDEIESILRDIPTGWQNYLYDAFVLAYGYGIIIGNLVEDTMIKTWELFCEFPKSLGFQASIYTDNPYWKNERTDGDWDNELIYNIKDCCITHECSNREQELLEKDPLAEANYRENVEILPILLYMMLQGMWIDQDEKERLLKEAKGEVERLQKIVDGNYLTSKLGLEAVEKYNKEVDKINHQISEIEDEKEKAKIEFEKKPLKKWSNKIAVSGRKIQRLKDKLKKLEYPSLNVKSFKQKDEYLYSKKGLGLIKPKKKLAESNDGVEKTATEAVIIIQKMVNKTTKTEVKEKLQNLLLLTIARTNVSDIEKLTVDPLDGRLRCSYSMFTETGRLTCRSSNVPLKGWKNFLTNRGF